MPSAPRAANPSAANPSAANPSAAAPSAATPSVADSLRIFSGETARIVESFTGADAAAALDAAAQHIGSAPRVFLLGAGRSGLALQMTAMRLMHLGLTVHVVGEVTTPAIARGDVLVAASGSGATAGILRSAQTAVDVGATIVCLTTDPQSALAELAAVTVVVPAAQKQDHGGTLSVQYAGGLFEQAVVLIGDAIFHSLWKASGASADELWPRHANLE
ncbi:6-phospho-3-hexuloisomerase [Glaciihabitans tibetensis]|uniref:6-phospho-3-hexuloisomerase n=1 Tax=Glaciihabitans tibetensis TaxID=1266600 RepID=A0A2T0VCI7_9MICO|nr:6-phospho-3-hexuloisomerase [Glaciihabitans tibetensis]PRY67897.1 6-phospho-3-hexuloisomerase [Glaciihabitans tibetensis]